MGNSTREDSQRFNHLLESLPLAPDSTCSYFPDRSSRFREFQFPGSLPREFFDVVMDTGYRRCGDMYYKTVCRTCRLCIPYRIPVDTFQPTRSQRRVLKLNEDVELRVELPDPTPEKIDLYLRYKYTQHYLKPMDYRDAEKPFDEHYHLKVMEFQMYTNPASSRELCLYLGNELIGFGTLDIVSHSVSAVYFVFDHKFADRSPGTLAILRGIDWARQQGLSHYHLGYFIPGHIKMDYKRKFGPAEFLNNETGDWELMTDAALAAYRNHPDADSPTAAPDLLQP